VRSFWVTRGCPWVVSTTTLIQTDSAQSKQNVVNLVIKARFIAVADAQAFIFAFCVQVATHRVSRTAVHSEYHDPMTFAIGLGTALQSRARRRFAYNDSSPGSDELSHALLVWPVYLVFFLSRLRVLGAEARDAGGMGSNPGRVTPKAWKNGTCDLPSLVLCMNG